MGNLGGEIFQVFGLIPESWMRNGVCVDAMHRRQGHMELL